ncbi:glycosyl transferase family 1 [Bryobacterales bacterium F-183]|nr:glycosyl transferase family 1 [Bryobacterales bacterium F-183]
MRVLQITAGAASMYCGSCIRDNNLAREMRALGHDVTLVPLYTPTLTDEENVAGERVFFGGISIYLQQKSGLFRKLPRFVDKLWDSPTVIRAATSRSIQTSPKDLGDLTVSTLEGREGVLRKEFNKLLEWVESEPRPDLIVLPYTLLISLAKPLRDALQRPVVCSLQGEDLFFEGLQEPWRTRCLNLVRSKIGDVDLFLPVSEFYERLMASYLDIPRSKMEVLPLGISFDGYEPVEKPLVSPLRIGYFARIAPEKGLHVLAEAFQLVQRELPDAVLEVAGYLDNKAYLATCQRIAPFVYHGTVDREAKQRFLARMDVLSVPSPYADPKGTYLLEAMAAGTPFVQPNHGAFPEIARKTGGGVLVSAAEPEPIAEELIALGRNRGRLRELAARGLAGVHREYGLRASAERAVGVYERVAGLAKVASA